MSELTPLDSLDWTAQWHLREQTLRAANTAIVNAHHRHPCRLPGAVGRRLLPTACAYP